MARAWAGWIAFAATMLVLVSALNIFQGIVALVDDERVFAAPDKFVVVDVTSWGWTLLLFGAAMLAVGVGLLAGQTWARFAGILVVGLHAFTQVASLGAYPVWSLLMIAMDTTVIFALTARWAEARDELRSDDVGAYPGEGLPGDAGTGQLPHEMARYQPRVF